MRIFGLESTPVAVARRYAGEIKELTFSHISGAQRTTAKRRE